jgi:hypothetical protein
MKNADTDVSAFSSHRHTQRAQVEADAAEPSQDPAGTDRRRCTARR